MVKTDISKRTRPQNDFSSLETEANALQMLGASDEVVKAQKGKAFQPSGSHALLWVSTRAS